MFKFLSRKPRNVGEGEISYVDVVTAYINDFQMNWWQSLIASLRAFQLADQQYKEVDEELVRMILDADVGDREDYEAEWYDCDDFAFNLMGIFHQNKETAAMPIFITWVQMPEGGHAVLSYIDFIGKVRIIEPQNDEVYSVPKGWVLSLLCG